MQTTYQPIISQLSSDDDKPVVDSFRHALFELMAILAYDGPKTDSISVVGLEPPQHEVYRLRASSWLTDLKESAINVTTISFFILTCM
jgi:hypothetical protein